MSDSSTLVASPRACRLVSLNNSLGSRTPSHANFAVVLAQVAGVASLSERSQAGFCQQLGLKEIPKGELVWLSQFCANERIPKERRGEVEEAFSSSLLFTVKEYPELVSLLQRNEAVLHRLQQGLELGGAWFPFINSTADPLRVCDFGPMVPEVRECVRLFALRCSLRRQQADFTGAIADIRNVFLLARFSVNHVFTIDQMVAALVESVASHLAMELLQQPAVTVAVVDELVAMRAALPAEVPLLVAFENGECSWALAHLDRMVEGGEIDVDFPFIGTVRLAPDVDRTALLAAGEQRLERQREICQMANFADQERACDDLNSDEGEMPYERTWWQYLRRRCGVPVRRTITAAQALELFSGSLTGLMSDRRRQVSRDLLDAAILIKTTQLQAGCWPESIEAAAEALGVPVPQDRWTAQPLKYRSERDRFLVWSCGPNRCDDEGRALLEPPGGDDIRLGPMI